MPSYIIPTVLLVGGSFVLFALLDWALWAARDWIAEKRHQAYLDLKEAERAHREWQEAHNKERT